MTARWLAATVLLAALAPACGEDSNERPPGLVGGSCKADATCDEGVCDPITNECVQTETGSSGDTGGESSTSTSAGECDLDTDGEEIPSTPADRPGDACCTRQSACTGREFNDTIPNPLYFGERLECVDEVWVAMDDACEKVCADWGQEMGKQLLYVGCYWDDGAVVCACSEA